MNCGSGGSKSRLAKAACAEPSGQMRDEQLPAVVARSTFPSQNVESTPGSEHFWKCDVEKVHAVVARSTFRCQKCKNWRVRNTVASWDVEKVHAVVARSTFRSQNVKSTTCSRHFWTSKCRFDWQAQGIVHRVKSEQNVRVLKHPKTMAGVGHLNRICKDAVSVAGAVQETCSSDTGSGRWFPERGCILEHQIFRFAEMILRDRCSISFDLALLFRGRRSTLDRWSGKIANRIGTRPSALHSTFHFWRMSRRIASFLMLSKFKNWGSLAELNRFGWCQVQELRKSPKIASFWMLSSSKTEEVSQNSFVFKLADRQIDR